MKKRILTLLLAMALLASSAVCPAWATDDNRTYDVFCQECNGTETWYALAAAADPMTDGHYFLAFSGTALTFGRKTISSGKEVCLLLENKEYLGNRHIILKSGATLNIQGPGTLSGRGEDTSAYGTYGDDGGAVRILEGATCNLRGGTVTYKINDSRTINYGGAVSVHGTFNVYDGQVKDGVANLAGGTVYVGATGVMNLYGGSISGGTVSNTADGVVASACVYNSGKILITDAAAVESIYLEPVAGGPALEEMLKFSGNYAGTTALYLSEDITLRDGLVLGTVEGTVAEGSILLPGTGYLVRQSGDQLIAKWPDSVENLTQGTGYQQLTQAAQAAQPGDVLQLNREITENVQIDKTLTLELNGNSIQGTVSVAEGQTLYVRDAQTADYDITDGKYGTIAAVSGSVLGAPATLEQDAYIRYTEADKGVSFHAVGLDLTAVNLRPSAAAIYYTAQLAGDSAVTAQVTTHGVALSVVGVPTAGNMDWSCQYTAVTDPFGATGEDAYSCLLRNIMQQTNTDAINSRNAQMPVYSCAYVQLADGTRVLGPACSVTLKEVVEAVDADWTNIPYPSQAGVVAMYEKYASVMDSWNIPRIREALNEEDTTLKILSIGQSHSADSIWLVQEVLQTERPDDKFFVAECLRSVTMVDHVANAKSDNAIYEYCVNTDGAWTRTEGWTIRQALQDQRWDYVIINESSRYLGLESVMSKGYVPEMVEFVRSNINYDFKLMYNWTWTTPINQVFHDPDFDPQPSKTFWNSFVRDYQADRKVHYESMLAMLEKYVEPIEGIDGILYSATPIQYATEVMGVPEALPTTDDPKDLPFNLADYGLYRDYIHLSDYGRLYIAYLWYAQFYGLEKLDAVNVDVIEAHLRHWRWVGQGDVVLTQQMKDWIIEAVNYALENPKQMP